jgi:hypothetical protein
MTFVVDSKANIAYKRVLGKAHTNNSRDPANEPYSSKNFTLAQDAWGDTIHTTPGDASNSGVVSDLLTLELQAVSGTDGTGGIPSSYLCKLGGSVPASLVGKINPLTGVAYAAGDRVGNIIPQYVNDNYRPKLFLNGVETAPLDASDWFIDCSAGIVTQETDVPANMKNYTTNGTVQCYVYVGKTVSQKISEVQAAATATTFYDKKSPGNGITGTIDGVNAAFTLANVPAAGSEHIYLNGVLQLETNDYTLVGATFTFVTPPVIGDVLLVSYRT